MTTVALDCCSRRFAAAVTCHRLLFCLRALPLTSVLPHASLVPSLEWYSTLN